MARAPQPPLRSPQHAGLCDQCRHMRLIESDSGSQFVRCERGLQDPAFPKYPRLPVLTCRGYEEADPLLDT